MTAPLPGGDYQTELDSLRDRLLAMAARCQDLTTHAVDALEWDDSRVARDLVPLYRNLDRDEREVDAMTARLFSLREPVGRDLRFLRTSLEITKTLERIGNETVQLASRVPQLHRAPAPRRELGEMGRAALGMLNVAIRSFIEVDPKAARAVIDRGRSVSEQYSRMLRSAMGTDGAAPLPAETAILVASCARHLERIADHATTIAKLVLYLEHGGELSRRPSISRVVA